MTAYLSTRSRTVWHFVCALSLVALLLSNATAQDTIVKVEEDWELIVANPDPNSNGPQITCAFSHLGDLSCLHATFEVNHQSLPDFTAGGLQLQLWNGEWPLSSHKFPSPNVMATQGEVVRWTQSIHLVNGKLVFEISNGTSTTWGNFGSQGYLRVSTSTTAQDLNGYNTNLSFQNSGIGYAANRVESLVLKRVRRFNDSGQMHEDDQPRVVH